jgi:hypothetical protein
LLWNRRLERLELVRGAAAHRFERWVVPHLGPDRSGDSSQSKRWRHIGEVYGRRGHRAFVQDVLNESIEPASDFPSGAYPNDKVVSRSNAVVEFETPLNSAGLGTAQSKLKQNGDPIESVAILRLRA